MENTETSVLDFNLTIDEKSRQYMRSNAKWNFFLAIMGFLFGGFVIFVGTRLALGADESIKPPFGSRTSLIFIYAFFTALFVVPNIYRLVASRQLLKALDAGDQELLNSSQRNQNIFSKIFGIVLAIFTFFYIVGTMIGAH
jgi:hypothetical protein